MINPLKKSHKRSQSEAVGFVVIILIVIIIGVIFLGIALRNKDKLVTDDAKISNFLSASLGYTTSCSRYSEGNYQSLDSVISLCYQGTNCLDNTPACTILNQTYSDLLPKFESAGIVLYYKLSLLAEQNTEEEEETSQEFLSFSKGNKTKCTSRRAGSSYITLDSEELTIALEICTS